MSTSPSNTSTPDSPVPSASTFEGTSTTSQPSGTTTPVDRASLIFEMDGRLYIASYLGNNPREVAVLPASKFGNLKRHGTRVAFATETFIGVTDLQTGKAEKLCDFTQRKSSFVPDVVWSTDGRRLAYVLAYEDVSALTFNRSVELGVIDLPSGKVHKVLTREDTFGLNVLGYDAAAQKMIVVPRGGDPGVLGAAVINAETGKTISRVGIQGDGEVFASPSLDAVGVIRFDYEQERALSIMVEVKTGRERRLLHPKDTFGVNHLWSPDGRYVAFTLYPGRYYCDRREGDAGLWLWQLGSGQSVKLDDASLTPLYWSPHGQDLLTQAQGVDGRLGDFYLIAADGSRAKVKLAVPTRAKILGWTAHAAFLSGSDS